MKVLVTGGAGYIGSFMVKALIERGYDVVVFDNMTRGNKNRVDERAELVIGDIRNRNDLESLFSEREIDSVMHFAGLISVEESTKNPELYYENNVVGSRNLFEIAISFGIDKFIFSSSAAVYGDPHEIPIREDHPKNPTSPYGENKLEVERILEELRIKQGIGYVCLRYFNACGASLDGSMGESHDPETHIIPLAIKAALNGSPFNLFGTDYDTLDGTCIRDYIHVLDLVEAHVLALEKLNDELIGVSLNVGTGHGFSNREIITSIEKIGNLHINVVDKPKRSGDADKLVADPAQIQTELGFKTRYSDIETIIDSALKWHRNNKNE